MRERTFTDTTLAFAIVVLLVTWMVTMVWAADQAPWLQAAHVLFFLIAIYGVSAALGMRADRRLDEVELAAARFGARWGLFSGVAFMCVLTFLPPFQSLLAGLTATFSRGGGYPSAVEARMFLLGIVATCFAQEAFRVAFTGAWNWSRR